MFFSLWILFLLWYQHKGRTEGNNEHRHSGIRYVTPAERHDGRDAEVLEMRRQVYEAAKSTHPGRWSNKTRNWDYIGEVWLNPPADANTSSTSARAA